MSKPKANKLYIEIDENGQLTLLSDRLGKVPTYYQWQQAYRLIERFYYDAKYEVNYLNRQAK